MSTYTVTKVRKAASADRSHTHIEGVFTEAGNYFTRRHVVDSIKAGDIWKTSAGGSSAPIHTINRCPKVGCAVAPYIATQADSSRRDNLENLPQA